MTHGQRVVIASRDTTVSASGEHSELDWDVHVVSVDTNGNHSPVELAMVVGKECID